MEVEAGDTVIMLVDLVDRGPNIVGVLDWFATRENTYNTIGGTVVARTRRYRPSGADIGGLKRVREHGGSVNLVCTNLQIKKLFNIIGLVKIFGIFDDEQSAIKALPRFRLHRERVARRRAAGNPGPR
jgi:hypothetical protein